VDARAGRGVGAVLGPPELPGPGEPGPFSLGVRRLITAILTDAGWTDVDVAGVSVSVEAPFLSGDARATAAMMSRTNPLKRDGFVTLQASASIVTAVAP
jgi:hypothetical protein